MRHLISILTILCLPLITSADVGFTLVTKENQKEASKNIFAVSQTKRRDQALDIAITIRPIQKWRLTRADLRFSAEGKTYSSAPLRLLADSDGSTRIEFVLAADMIQWSQVDILLDLSDPDVPTVGHLYRLALSSYFNHN